MKNKYKQMKQLLIVLFCILMCVSGFARDFSYTYAGRKLTFTVIDENERTCKTYEMPSNYYIVMKGSLIIPAEAIDENNNKYTVTEIGNYSFQGSELTKVTLPSTIKKIGFKSFFNNESLEDINLPDSLEVLEENAFSSCTNLKEVLIPNTVIKMGKGVYQNCTSLRSITLGNSLSIIPENSFYNSGITSIILPESIKKIQSSAFAKCQNIEKVICLGKEPAIIDRSSFDKKTCSNSILDIPDNCLIPYMETQWSNFSNIIVGGSNTKFFYDGVFNYYLIQNKAKPEAILIEGDYSNMTEANIPERVTDDTNPNNYIRYNVTAIGPGAFKNCRQLRCVNFNGRTHIGIIGASAFSKCWNLQTIDIPNSVTQIDSVAFYGCSDLKSVNIPNSIRYIGYNAFEDCNSLRKAEFESPESLCKIRFESTFSNPLSFAHNLYINGKEIKDVIIPTTVDSIGFGAFSGGENLISIEIPNSVKAIGGAAFYNCTSLELVKMSDSVKCIDQYAFANCSSLSTLHLPSSLTEIGYAAFAWCNGLKKISIPNSVKEVGSFVLYECKNLVDLIIEDGTSPIIFYDYALYKTNIESLYMGRDWDYKKSEALTSNIKTLKIGNQVKKISDYGFNGCQYLTEVILPPSVEFIGQSAFANNYNLSKVIMGYNVKQIGENAFNGSQITSIYITAQTPPNAPNNVFSSYSGKLYLQDPGDRSIIDKYYDAYTCWDRFNSYSMIKATNIKYNGYKKISGNPGFVFKLNVQVQPENVTLPYIFWRSTNPEIATVDADGFVTFQSKKDDIADTTCKIIAETLYADGPVLEIEIDNSDFGGVENIMVDCDDIKKSINFDEHYEVYSLSGVSVGNDIKCLNRGIYIIRQNEVVKKYILN